MPTSRYERRSPSLLHRNVRPRTIRRTQPIRLVVSMSRSEARSPGATPSGAPGGAPCRRCPRWRAWCVGRGPGCLGRSGLCRRACRAWRGRPSTRPTAGSGAPSPAKYATRNMPRRFVKALRLRPTRTCCLRVRRFVSQRETKTSRSTRRLPQMASGLRRGALLGKAKSRDLNRNLRMVLLCYRGVRRPPPSRLARGPCDRPPSSARGGLQVDQERSQVLLLEDVLRANGPCQVGANPSLSHACVSASSLECAPDAGASAHRPFLPRPSPPGWA